MTLVSWIIPLVAVFRPKIRLLYHGRKHQTLPELTSSPVWIHCASLGEFEQGRPLIEALRKEWPEVPLVLTFFSSSGYELRKNYNQVNWVGYLPLDLPGNANRFVERIQPRLVIFVKYEYWFNYLVELDRKKIPFIFISNVWRSHYFPLKWWAGWFLKTIKKGKAFFVQDQISAEILQQNKFPTVFLTGDTRIDRVLDLIKQPMKSEQLISWAQGSTVFIGGSTWPEDEKILFEFLEKTPGLRMILAPHDPTAIRLKDLYTLFKPYQPIYFSQWKGEQTQVLIIDSVGLLNSLYGYAQAAFIGGGFDQGIPNTLEAAVYGIPVFFGPRHTNFKEARDFLAQNLGFEIHRRQDLIQKWSAINPEDLNRIKQQLHVYFMENQGATAKIIDYLRGFIQN